LIREDCRSRATDRGVPSGADSRPVTAGLHKPDEKPNDRPPALSITVPWQTTGLSEPKAGVRQDRGPMAAGLYAEIQESPSPRRRARSSLSMSAITTTTSSRRSLACPLRLRGPRPSMIAGVGLGLFPRR